MNPQKPEQSREASAWLYSNQAARHGKTVTALKPIPADPWEFVRDCVLTVDEHAKAKGLPYIRKLIAEDERTGSYLEFLTNQWHTGGNKQQWKKSRQLRVTWLLSALHLWETIKHPGTKGGYQAKKFEDADAYLFERFWFIYENIPTDYAKPKARYVSGAIEVFHKQGTEVPTSQILALAEGPNQVRQYTFTWLWRDEAAFHADQKEAHGAAQPTLDGGGRDIKTSSSGGSLTFFYDLAEKDIAPGFRSSPVDVFQGIKRWNRNGYVHLFIHYSADPLKRPGTQGGDAWIKQASEGQPTDQWLREMEGDDTVQPGIPVFCDTNRIVVKVQDYRPTLRLFGGFDPGYLWPFWYDLQIEETFDDQGQKVSDVVHYLHEYVMPNTEVYTFGAWVKAERERLYGKGKVFTDYGDDASKQHKETGQVASILRSMGFNIFTKPTGPGGVVKALHIGQRLISAGCVEIDPQCKFLLQAVKSGFIRGDDGLPVTGDEGHPFADAVQAAIQYPCVNIFGYSYQAKNRILEGIEAPSAQPNPVHWSQVRGGMPENPRMVLTGTGSTAKNRNVQGELTVGQTGARSFTPKRFDYKEAYKRK